MRPVNSETDGYITYETEIGTSQETGSNNEHWKLTIGTLETNNQNTGNQQSEHWKMAIRKLETGDWSSRKLGIGTVENGGLEALISIPEVVGTHF